MFVRAASNSNKYSLIAILTYIQSQTMYKLLEWHDIHKYPEVDDGPKSKHRKKYNKEPQTALRVLTHTHQFCDSSQRCDPLT